MPKVPPPESLPADEELLRDAGRPISLSMQNYLTRDRPIELRPVETDNDSKPRAGTEARRDIWIKARSALSDAPAIHHSVFAYASDLTIIETALLPTGGISSILMSCWRVWITPFGTTGLSGPMSGCFILRILPPPPAVAVSIAGWFSQGLASLSPP